MRIPEIEKSTPEKINTFQEGKIAELLQYLNEYSPYYKKLFKAHQLNIESIRKLEDLVNIPVTTKDDLQQYNKEFICVPQTKIIDYANTSGTLGEPVSIPLTEADLNRLSYNEAISLACAGGNEHELYQLTTTIDKRFMAGMAYFLGARELSAGIIRVGAGNPELQWKNILELQPTALIIVPSFLLKLLEYAELKGIDYIQTSVKKAICIGESIRDIQFNMNRLAARIHEKWPIQLFSTYASTEMATAFTECEFGVGGHHHPELLIAEFLDENNNPVPDGQTGELTITNLGITGFPLLRFKTGDICIKHTSPCSCGRNTFRISPVLGRKQQMIKFKGTSLYPPALYDILDGLKNINHYVVEASSNEFGNDSLTLLLDVNESFQEKSLVDHFRTYIRVTPNIKYLSAEKIKALSMPQGTRKPIKFIDKRLPQKF